MGEGLGTAHRSITKWGLPPASQALRSLEDYLFKSTGQGVSPGSPVMEGMSHNDKD